MNLLNEATRRELINKSEHADIVKQYGTTRYDRNKHQTIFDKVSDYNKLDNNSIFKDNRLSFVVPIHGETNDYGVKVVFDSICTSIKDEIKNNGNKLEYKCVYRAIISTINKRDVLVSCTCNDWKYRLSYYATKHGYNSGKPEIRPSKITNPHDTKGAGCKHVLNVLDSLDWAVKLASAVYNYITYMRKNMPDKYNKFIYPKLYDKAKGEPEDIEELEEE